MCVNIQSVLNKYTGKFVNTSCRHCCDCLVQSYRRIASKIHNEMCDSDYNYFFVTLTYSNDFLPFIDITDLSDDGLLLVYRHKLRHDRVTLPSYIKDSSNWLSSYCSCHCIDCIDISTCDDFSVDSLLSVPCPIGDFSISNIGIVYNKDIFNFFKRLRRHLEFHYGYSTDSFTYYQISEYGETTYRPHFHVLFKTKISDEIFRSAIIASWQMCDFSKVERWFERAISPANYISIYAVSKISLPSGLRAKCLSPSRSHSLHFGFANIQLQADRFFESVLQGVTTYRVLHQTGQGLQFVNVPFPVYVCNRYFPKFKGYNRLSLSQKFIFYQWFAELPRYDREYDFIRNLTIPVVMETIVYRCGYTFHDLWMIFLCFRRVQVYADSLDLTMYDYIIIWHRFYYLRLSHLIQDTYKDVNYKYLIDGLCHDDVQKRKFLDKLELSQFLVLSTFSKTNKIKRHYLSRIQKLNYV